MFILVLKNSPSSLDYRMWDIDEIASTLLVQGNITGIGKPVGKHSYLYEFGSGNGKSQTSGYEEAINKINNTIKIAAPGFKRIEGVEIDIDAVGYIFRSKPSKVTKNAMITESFVETLEETDLSRNRDEDLASDLGLVKSSMEYFTSAMHAAIFDELMFKYFSPEIMLYPISAELSLQGKINKLTHGALRLKSILGNAKQNLGSLPRRIIVCDIDETTHLTAIKGDAVVASTHEYGGTSKIFSTGNCGAVNPAVVKALSEKTALPYEEIIDNLTNRSGVKIFGEGFKTIRELVKSIRLENISAPVQMFASHIIYSIAGLVALLGGVELLIISGSIGSDFPILRTLLIERLHILRLSVDESKNENKIKNAAEITGKDCKVKIVVARPDEHKQAVKEIYDLIQVE